jgi:hypothetical protein
MTMNEAIIEAQEQGGSYIAPFGRFWYVLGRTIDGHVKGLIYVSFDGATFRV